MHGKSAQVSEFRTNTYVHHMQSRGPCSSVWPILSSFCICSHVGPSSLPCPPAAAPAVLSRPCPALPCPALPFALSRLLLLLSPPSRWPFPRHCAGTELIPVQDADNVRRHPCHPAEFPSTDAPGSPPHLARALVLGRPARLLFSSLRVDTQHNTLQCTAHAHAHAQK